jgi:serine/threonine-protein kinase
MAPEQATADPSIDHRADIYSFGVMAYEMLTGSLPFAGRSIQATLAAHAIEQPEPIERRRSGIPRPLAALVMRCLEKRPADRPQDAAELVTALDSIHVGDGRSPASATRSRSMRIIGAIAIVLVVVGAVYMVVTGRSLALGGGSAGAGAQSVTQLRSVAVLPLANVGGDASDEYFSDGMSSPTR